MLYSDGQYSAFDIFTTSCFENQVVALASTCEIFAWSVRLTFPEMGKSGVDVGVTKSRDVRLGKRKAPGDRLILIG